MTTLNERVDFGYFGRDDAGNTLLTNERIIALFAEMENPRSSIGTMEPNFWEIKLPSLECIAVDRGIVVPDEEAAHSEGARISMKRLRSESAKCLFAAIYRSSPTQTSVA